MSEDLSRACDTLLRSTSILKHSYGVPKWPTNLYKGSKLHPLESKYADLHKELSRKLNKLIYLSELDVIYKLAPMEIDSQYQTIINEFSMIDPNDLKRFLSTQNENFKTELLMNEYLQIILPVLRSVHHINLTLTEKDILHTLKSLYEDESGIIYSLMNEYNSSNENQDKLNDNYTKISNLLLNAVKPKILKLNELDKKIELSSDKLVNGQKQRVAEVIDELDSTPEGNELIAGFKSLIAKWNYLSILCDFLPSLITSLPTNWFKDESLFNIIIDCEKLSERVRKYQLLVNINSFKNFSLQDLLMLNFVELEE